MSTVSGEATHRIPRTSCLVLCSLVVRTFSTEHGASARPNLSDPWWDRTQSINLASKHKALPIPRVRASVSSVNLIPSMRRK
ncbi:hypothetical protein B0H16DRAFT_1569782 [Mycena metata]|uniref:Uncharacterized protein n=1 Tax=Mycena metata TaxID=1033252 RepID=A0AAD7IAL9_9AGAR|nr:hypothetical protein B0H16DRAFT_1569782 [Mycena metata]